MKQLTILVWLCNLDNRAKMYWNKMQYYLNNLTMVRSVKQDVEFIAVVNSEKELNEIKACELVPGNEEVESKEVCKGITKAFIKTESKTKFLAKLKREGYLHSERIIFVDTEDFINLHNLEEVVNYLKEDKTNLIKITNTKIGEEFSWEIKEGNPKPINIKNSLNKNTIFFTKDIELLENFDLDVGYDVLLSRIQQQTNKLVLKNFKQNFIAFDKSNLVYSKDQDLKEFVSNQIKLFEALSITEISKNPEDTFPSIFNAINVTNALIEDSKLTKGEKKEMINDYFKSFKKIFANGNRKLFVLTPTYFKIQLNRNKQIKK